MNNINQLNIIFSDNECQRNKVVNRESFKFFAGKCLIDASENITIFINGKKCFLREGTNDITEFVKIGENFIKNNGYGAVKLSVPYSVIQRNTTETAEFNTDKIRELDNFIDADIKNGFPGAVLLVIKDGKVIKESSYGYKRKYLDGGALLDKPEKMDISTIFDIASNSKMYSTNFALMKLVSEGVLDINAPVCNYMPDYKNGGREKIAVKHLLTHTAGYAPEVLFYLPDNGLGDEFHSLVREKTIHLLMNKVPFVYRTGEKTIYSDTDYMLLGLIIEAITGQRQDEYVESEIFKPLGLTDTMYIPLEKGKAKNEFAATEIIGTTRGNRRNYPDIRTHVLQGEVHDEKAFYSLGGIAGHAGLFSTAYELGVLTQVLLNGGGYGDIQLFSQDSIDQFTKPSDFDMNFGLGWRRGGNRGYTQFFGSYASNYSYGHTGWTGTLTIIDPKYNLSIILLTNRKHSEVYGNNPFPLEKFRGDDFETGQYGSVVSLIYEAFLEN